MDHSWGMAAVDPWASWGESRTYLPLAMLASMLWPLSAVTCHVWGALGQGVSSSDLSVHSWNREDSEHSTGK